MSFRKKHIDVVGLQETCTRNSTFRVCGGSHMVTSAAVGREGWKFGSGIVFVMLVIFLFLTPRQEFK